MNFFYQLLFLFSLAYSIILYLFLTINAPSNHHLILDQSLLNNPDESSITGLILDFENFDNDLYSTVKNVCNIIPNIVVFSKTFIYPRINFSDINHNCDVKIIELEKSIFDNYHEKDLFNYLKSDYLFILPDSIRIVPSNIDLVHQLGTELNKLSLDALLIPIDNVQINCDYFHFNVKHWTLTFFDQWQNNSTCLYQNDLIVFIRKESLRKLSFPFLRPFLRSFLLQSQIFNFKIKLLNEKLFSSNLLPKSLFNEAKKIYYINDKIKFMNEKLGIKKIIYPNNSIEWFGCDRYRPRCFGSIKENIPDYLIKDRWLPPCCRRNLEITGRYVFQLLEKFQIRYWLEGGSLLGAARNGQIIDWDYDIDIGIYQHDMDKLPVLKDLFSRESGYRMEDGQGYIWEKALEGEFIKVHYSQMNRIHVDIFPFISINGTMTKETWFVDHPQDIPFPETFLKPMEKIQFINWNASAPNNIRAFLEMKFGQNAIEEKKYPNE